MTRIIAITQRVALEGKTKEKRDCLDQRWTSLFNELGWLPLILPNNIRSGKKILEQSRVSGIILTGGNTPGCIKAEDNAPERDELENMLIGYGIRNKIAVIGVCRGMQMIGCYFGAVLKPVKGHIKKTHALSVSGISKFRKFLRPIKEANSFHRYSLSSPGDGMIVSARSEDGEIEAIEHTKHRILGMMWHPERSMLSNGEKGLLKTLISGK